MFSIEYLRLLLVILKKTSDKRLEHLSSKKSWVVDLFRCKSYYENFNNLPLLN